MTALANIREEQVAVGLAGLEKCFRLYRSPVDRMKEALHPFGRKYSYDFFALKKIDLLVRKGETVGIIGLNGSGKSTLLKIICGVLQPSAGTIRIDGRISALLELGSGFNPEFTGRQNVFFAGALAGIDRPEMNKRFEEIIQFADIGDFLEQPVKNYSSGMLVRLAFAVAINVSPDILIIDEALAVGDARFQHKCLGRIQKFKGNSTILLVSHDLNAILQLCDRVVWLHQGRVVEIGPPQEVIKGYTKANYEGVEEVESEKKEEPPCAVETSGIHSDSFGKLEAEVVKTRFSSQARGTISSVIEGEDVCLELWIKVKRDIEQPVIGFRVMNRLGLFIFGYNNLVIDQASPPFLAGETKKVTFRFQWPILMSDSYGITVAVTEGTLEDHDVHHWIHDVLVVESIKKQKGGGLLGLKERVFEVS